MAGKIAVKNTHRAIYLDTSGGSGEASYERLGNGVTSFTPSTNPTVDTKHYIDASSPSHSVTAVERQYAFNADVIKGEACLDYLSGLDGATGDKCKSIMVDVDLAGEATGGAYPAKKYNVLIAIEQPYSIEGGENQQMSGTIYTNGDYEEGTFNPSTKAWTAKSTG